MISCVSSEAFRVCPFERFARSPLAYVRGVWLDACMFHSNWFTLIVIILATSCANPPPLNVTSYVLRDQAHHGDGADPMARNEKLRRLHGAVSMEERKNLLGQYYTINWNDTDIKKGPASITFEYQQGTTGSQVKTQRHNFAKIMTHGTSEIAIIGDDYFQGGRVLAWRATLRRGDETITTRQSYLWQ